MIKASVHQIDDLVDQDVQLELSQFLDKFLVDPIYKYYEVVATPKVFADFIKAKLTNDLEALSQGHLQEDYLHNSPLYAKEAIDFHASELK